MMEGSDPPGEGVHLLSNLGHYGRMDGGDPTNHWERRRWDIGMMAAIAARHELAGALHRASPGCGSYSCLA
jgi:hypothetical protein